MPTPTVDITAAQQRKFQQDGYFILESVISDSDLEMLRSECARFIEMMNAEMDRMGTTVSGINHRDNRYFIAHPSQQSPLIRKFAFSELMADICRATLGPTAFLAWEQFVVKAAEKGAKFSWHQDAGYGANAGADVSGNRGLSCWCALDDMSEANGTVYLLPYSRAGGGKLMPHVRDDELNDLVGYHGDDPGEPVIAPAGSIAVFSGLVFHRSGFNTTNRMRRVYLSQYSSAQSMKADGSGPFGPAVPFLREGERVDSGE
jgi:ectoine hydroxylase-related dioxygenase (phytanoyl-CoA dioxygenase family)